MDSNSDFVVLDEITRGTYHGHVRTWEVIIASSGGLENLHNIDEMPDLLGGIGKWQEYYYYDEKLIQDHQKQIFYMKKAIFLSAEMYGLFLYKYKGEVWLEKDRGYQENELFTTPKEFYDSLNNYRVIFTLIPKNRFSEWIMKMNHIEMT